MQAATMLTRPARPARGQCLHAITNMSISSADIHTPTM
jgi:hypothetical protein